jgi:uncharacterized protein (DUF1778 family)
MARKIKKKAATINVRARSADVALIDQAARILGKSRSEFIRYAAEVRARRILELTGAPQCLTSTR